MADTTTVQQRIIASVFSRRNTAGNLAETYVSHVKIWEEGEGGKKPRYILLSQAGGGGGGYIHKSKLNTNGSFSVGKTWNMQELRGLQVVNSLEFNITLSRTYRWNTENEADQAAFLDALIRLFRNISNGQAPLRLEGIAEPYSAKNSAQGNYTASAYGDRPPSRSRSNINMRARTPSQDRDFNRGTSPQPRSQSRNGMIRPPSPPMNNASAYGSPSNRSRDTSRPRPISPTPSQVTNVSVARPRTTRRPSNAASTISQIPHTSDSNLQLSANDSSSRQRASNAEPSSALMPDPSQRSQESRPVRTSPPSNSVRPRQVSRGISSEPNQAQTRREAHARVSFFDPGNQAVLDRLIMTNQAEIDGEEESMQATMANVEEMLEGYDWASDDIIGKRTTRGTADLIEARLLDELMALEKANIHSFLESDDRITVLLKYIDESLSQLHSMDTLVSSYKIHLNAVGDDISFIQSQNRGLQVQTQNQKLLLNELENVLQTVHVGNDALSLLTQASLDKSVEPLEEAATVLYKALLAGRDTDMAATMERLEEYKTHNAQFCKRIHDYLSIMFTAEAQDLLINTDGGLKKDVQSRPTLIAHETKESHLGRYAGLILYLKEMDETMYGKLCGAYYTATSTLHLTQIKALFSAYVGFIKKRPEEGDELGSYSLTPTASSSKGASGIRRAGTIIRSPMDRKDKDKRATEGDITASEAFGLLLEQLAPQIHREDEFIQDFLQINDAALTFADYMGLDNYFRRQATRTAGLSHNTLKLVRGAMDLIFSFLPAELKPWLDTALEKDSMQIIGLLASLERFSADAEERGNAFLLNLLDKQHMRLKGIFERHVNQQIKNVEQTKLTSKKRRGVAHFIRSFPFYVERVESQLIGADNLEIRSSVDAAYDRIVQTMFESLKHMAKMEGEGVDKEQLNYHVIIIENMHHFVAEMSRQELGSMVVFVRRAEGVYDENLNGYVKIVLRRPFARILDYFEGIERLLKTTAPTEVSSNSQYSRSALKKVIKEYNSKDVRKHIDTLFKRVEKHFTEASEKTTTDDSGPISAGLVMTGVWKACEEELIRVTELFSKRLAQCYADSGLSLEYTVADVESAFRRHS